MSTITQDNKSHPDPQLDRDFKVMALTHLDEAVRHLRSAAFHSGLEFSEGDVSLIVEEIQRFSARVWKAMP